jgi:hypothetical protein
MFVATLRSTDPVVFARDENNDIIIPLRKASGLEAVLILVRTAWLLWRDEWFLNRDVGTPWLETEDGVVTERDAILGQVYDAAKVARALRTEALAIPGVVDLAEFKSSFNGETRNLACSGVIKCQFADSVTAQGAVTVAIAA